jgi:hypothetical protein
MDLISNGGKLLILSVYLLLLSFFTMLCAGGCAINEVVHKKETKVPNNLVIANCYVLKFWEQRIAMRRGAEIAMTFPSQALSCSGSTGFFSAFYSTPRTV